MKTPTYAVTLAILVACAQPAFASEVTELAEGSRVRVTLQAEPDRRIEGTLAMLDEKLLTLAVDGNRQTLALERTAVTRIEQSRGRSGRRAAGLGLVGGAVGLGAAAALAFLHYGEGSGSEANWLVALPIAGAAAGVALGIRERWQTVTPTARVGLRPGQPGLGRVDVGGVPVAPLGQTGVRVTPTAAGIGVSIALGF